MTESVRMPGFPCEVCGRASDGFAWQEPGRPFRQFCSRKCGEIYMKSENLTRDEAAAVTEGGMAGGEYLDSIGKFDLRTLNGEEWAEFCGRIYRETCAELARQAADTIPF